MSSIKEIPFLKSINITSDITTEIIRRCEEQLQNDNEYIKLKSDGMDFKKVIPYGNPEDPCFQVTQVFKFINPNELHIHRRLATYFTEGRHYFKAKITEDKKEPCNMFTRHGLMKAMYMGKTPLSEMFQNYVFDLLDGLWKNEKDVMKKQMKITEKNLEEERTKRREAEVVNLQNIYLQEAYCNDFESNDSNGIELTILRRLHLTKYYLYIVDWNYVNTKYWMKLLGKSKEPKPVSKTTAKTTETNGINLDSSDDDIPSARDINRKNCENFTKVKTNLDNPHKDGIQESYEFEFITLTDLENSSNDEFYLHITNKEIDPKKTHFKFITHIYLDKTKHFNDMVKYITHGEPVIDRTAYPVNGHDPNEIKTADFSELPPIKNIYKTTYEMVLSARNRTFVNIHREELKN
jgi:hypothetical protein